MQTVWLKNSKFQSAQFTATSKWLVIFTATFFIFSGAASATTINSDFGEQYFEQAKQYTVKIQTTISVPFKGDTKGTATGAGFVTDSKRGWIFTNAHVVSKSPATIEVTTFDKKKVFAQRLYVDSFLDFAILQIDPKVLDRAANLDCEKTQAIGLPVGAFGHPFDQPFTGTKGIVSGVRDDFDDMQGAFVQTDAPINPGNSGGPLINLKTGQVIAMNTARRGGDAQNTNYALEVKQLCRISAILKEGKDPRPPQIRFSFFKDDDGRDTLRIGQILNEQESKIQSDDLIVDVDGIPVKTEAQFVDSLRGKDGNTALTIIRDGKKQIIQTSFQYRPPVLGEKGVFASGVLFLEETEPEILEILQAQTVIVVGYVEPGSEAESKRIVYGSIIEKVNGRPIRTLDELYKIAASSKKLLLRMKSPSFKRGHLFTFAEREVPVTDLRWITKQNMGHAEEPIKLTSVQK